MNTVNWQARPSRHLLLLILVTAGMIFLYGQIPYTTEPYARWDLYHYRQITAAAPQITNSVQQPFAYRLLGPYLAGLLPLPDATAYYLLTVTAALLLVVLTYFFLLAWPLTPPAALLATLLFVFNKHLFGFNVWDFFALNDVLSLIFLVILLWALMHQRWPLFALILALGAATRETALIMLPVALAYLIERRLLGQHARALLLAALPGIVVFGALRLLVGHTGGLNLLEQLARSAPKLLAPETWFRLLLNSFLPVSLLPLVFWRHTLAFFRGHRYLLVYLALILVSAFFGYDNERLMAPAFIVFYPLIAAIVESQRLTTPRGLPWLLVGAGFAASFQHLIGRYPLPAPWLTYALSLGATLCATLACILAARTRRSPTLTPATLATHSSFWVI